MIIRGNTVGTNMSPEQIAGKIGTGLSAKYMIVTYWDDVGSADYGSREIWDHVENGGIVYLNIASQYVPLQWAVYTEAHFAYHRHDGTLVKYIIDSDCGLAYSATSFATATDVGNISHALDELHTYAQGLINGGAAV